MGRIEQNNYGIQEKLAKDYSLQALVSRIMGMNDERKKMLDSAFNGEGISFDVAENVISSMGQTEETLAKRMELASKISDFRMSVDTEDAKAKAKDLAMFINGL